MLNRIIPRYPFRRLFKKETFHAKNNFIQNRLCLVLIYFAQIVIPFVKIKNETLNKYKKSS